MRHRLRPTQSSTLPSSRVNFEDPGKEVTLFVDTPGGKRRVSIPYASLSKSLRHELERTDYFLGDLDNPDRG